MAQTKIDFTEKGLYTTHLLLNELIWRLEKTSFITKLQAKIISQLLIRGKYTGKELSRNLNYPDSKIYPALKNLKKFKYIQGTNERPAKFYIDNPHNILRALKEIHQLSTNEFNQNLTELESLIYEAWMPLSKFDDQQFSYIVRKSNLEAEILSLIKSSNVNLKLILSENIFRIITPEKLFNYIIAQAKGNREILLALPPQYIKKINSILCGENCDLTHAIELPILDEINDPIEPAKLDNEIVKSLAKLIADGKIILKSLLGNFSSYILQDEKNVAHIMHHEIEPFAIISNELLYVSSLSQSWSNVECCQPIKHIL